MNKRGFTILEIIIATAILLIGVTVTFSIIPKIYRLNQKAWNMSKAAFLAQEKLDDLIEKNVLIDTQITGTQTDHPAELQDCTRTWVGESDPYGNSNIQVIKVKVQWEEPVLTGNITRNAEVQGLVAP